MSIITFYAWNQLEKINSMNIIIMSRESQMIQNDYNYIVIKGKV